MTESLQVMPSVAPPGPDNPLARRAAISVVRLYQRSRGTRLSPCRYVPSCSEYAAEALDRHGLVRGSWLAIRRLGRCRPLAGYGSDPVPD